MYCTSVCQKVCLWSFWVLYCVPRRNLPSWCATSTHTTRCSSSMLTCTAPIGWRTRQRRQRNSSPVWRRSSPCGPSLWWVGWQHYVYTQCHCVFFVFFVCCLRSYLSLFPHPLLPHKVWWWGWGYWNHHVHLSICPFVCLSVCLCVGFVQKCLFGVRGGYTGITVSICPSVLNLSICLSVSLCVRALSRSIFWTAQPFVTKRISSEPVLCVCLCCTWEKL